VKNDPFELRKKDREAAEKRTRENARKNPDFLPLAFQDIRCACVNSVGKPKKLFRDEHDARMACAWLNQYRPEQPPQIPCLCPETKHFHLKNMN